METNRMDTSICSLCVFWRKHSNKGFTLVELLVAMSLIVIFTSISIARFIQNNQAQRAKATTDRVKQVFLEAKSNAISGKKDCGVCGGSNGLCDGAADDLTLVSWRVRIVEELDGSHRLRIEGVCSGNTLFMQRSETLPMNINFATAGPCNTSEFLPDGTGSLSQPCTVTSSGGGKTYSVSISTTGLVSGEVN